MESETKDFIRTKYEKYADLLNERERELRAENLTDYLLQDVEVFEAIRNELKKEVQTDIQTKKVPQFRIGDKVRKMMANGADKYGIVVDRHRKPFYGYSYTIEEKDGTRKDYDKMIEKISDEQYEEGPKEPIQINLKTVTS